jgi:regulatory protein YycH of two-component signal transduction system YycFG
MMKKALLLVMSVVLTGCLVTVDSDSRQLQSVWNETDVTRLQIGTSDNEWVRTTFGDPISKLNYADGSEIWKYRNRSEKDTEVGVFLIFSVDVEEERTETLSIEFTEGLVTNYWIEEDRF